ncbi:MAG: CPBP family intramembrane glutamic endopeptidase [Fimbriimonas sp.]
MALPGLTQALQALVEPDQASKLLFTPFSAAIGTLASCVQVTAVVLYVVWRSGEGWTKFGIRRIRWVDDLGTGVIWTVVLVLGGLILPVALQRWMRWESAYRPEAREYFAAIRRGGFDFPALTLLALVMNSVAEELAMRGFLIPRLEARLRSTSAAIVVSAAGFSAYHLYQGWLPALDVFVIGLLMGVIFARQRRLVPLIIAHTCVNLAAFARGFG